MSSSQVPAGLSLAIQDQLTQATQRFAYEILQILSGTTLSDLTSLTGRALQQVVAGITSPQQAAVPTETNPPKRGRGRPRKIREPVLPEVSPLAYTPVKKDVPVRTSALRKLAGTKPVICPIAGCNNHGVRSKMNFCHEHFAQTNKAERIKLRQLQKARHIPDSLLKGSSKKPR